MIFWMGLASQHGGGFRSPHHCISGRFIHFEDDSLDEERPWTMTAAIAPTPGDQFILKIRPNSMSLYQKY
jgi:hypothetical protein